MDEYVGLGEFVPRLRGEWIAEREIPLQQDEMGVPGPSGCLLVGSWRYDVTT